MKDPELVVEILEQIEEAITRILYYFSPIDCVEDFIKNQDSLMRLDAIGMILIAIRENLKKLDKEIDPLEFQNYPDIDWKGAKGIRDILSHSYFQLQPDTILQTCQKDIPLLHIALQSMKLKMKSINL